MALRTCTVVLAVAMSIAACQKSSEQQAAEAARASAVAHEKAEEATRELERGNTRGAARAMVESQEASERARREAAEAAEAVAREHERYHVLLTKEIAWIDRRLGDLERNARSSDGALGALGAEKDKEILAAREWRARLQEDLERVDHRGVDSDWTALKMKIDRDLERNRPPSFPRSYEKPYGI